MDDKTIGELTAISEVTDASLIPVEQNGDACKMTAAQLKAYVKTVLGGFAFTKDANDKMIVTYTDPTTNEAATPVAMPTNTTLSSVVTQLTNVANNLKVSAGL